MPVFKKGYIKNNGARHRAQGKIHKTYFFAVTAFSLKPCALRLY
jgi:hypothetical protein